MIFVLFGEALGCLEGSLELPWGSFGHLFGVFLAWSHVDVNRLPVDLPLRELKGSKMSRKGAKIGGTGNQLTLMFVIGFRVRAYAEQPVNIHVCDWFWYCRTCIESERE